MLRERVTVTVAGATERDLERDPHARGARIPTQVHEAIRAGLAAGPVLVQTPRSGYAAVPGLRALPHPGPLRRPAPGRWR